MSRPTALVLSILLATAAHARVGAIEPRAMVVTQPESPIQITKYSPRYLAAGKADAQGINHRVEYRNRTERRIEAVEIGFVEFDIWNEHIDTLVGNDLDAVGAGKSGDGSWLHDPPAAFIFHTGIAYVSRVRFADGEIWTASLEETAGQIRSVDASFQADLLKPKRRQ